MEIPQALTAFMAVITFIVGAMVGSFLNVCVYRLPAGMSVVKPRSRCPKCEQPIIWYDNIPIVSWLLLGAKCRNCQAPISWQYPLVEGITGVVFLLVFWRFGFVVATPIYMLLGAGLVLVTFVDLTDWTIPNEVTLPGIPIGIACALIAMFYPESGLHVEGPLEPVFDALLGVVLGGGLLYGLDKLSLLLLKKPGMGFGDVKLLAMLGAFFGWPSVILIVMIAAVVGSVFGISMILIKKARGGEKSDHYLPFGPYLALAGFLVLLFGHDLYAFYLDYTRIGP
jgi:leader peptidase (prepilin peptidase) / N-methyltransferase